MMPQLRRGQKQNVQATMIPAAIGGINAVKSLSAMAENEAIYCYNILPEDFGMEVRDGYQEWANGWTGGAAKTVMPFEGNAEAEDRLFVASPEGIFDVTAEGETTPTQVVTFPSSAGQAGICHSVNYGNDAGDRFLLVTDGENGYYVWTQTTDTWDKIAMGGGGITGVDPALFNFIMIWKSRLWFIQRDSGLAWFLTTAEAFLGAAVQFNWGDQFRFGGPLVSLHNWTLDGGNGIDDYLVGFSGSGDAIVYQGTDPTSKNDFGLVGSWYVGELPFGNRIATEFSGELYVLSVQGLLPMSAILNGSGINNPSTYVTNKVSPYIRSVMDSVENTFGWHVHIHPKQSLLYVNTPPRLGQEQLAFTLYYGHESWGMIRGLNKSHTANWRGEVYWTDINRNKLFIQRGHVDAVFLDRATDGDPQAIDWQVLGSYNHLGSPATYKRVQYIRPMFIGEGDPPSFEVQAYYDYDVSELSTPPVFLAGGSALWSSAGSYTFSLESDGADVLVLSIADGTVALSGVATIDVTLGAHPVATLTFNGVRYEGPSVGVAAFLTTEIGNSVATTIDPDILASTGYTLIPLGLLDGDGADNGDAGFRPPITLINGSPPPYQLPVSSAVPPPLAQGSLQPSVISGTAVPVTGAGTWNGGIWAGGIQANDNPRGANGLGRHVAINIRGRTANSTTLVSFDIIWDAGGFM